MNPTYTLGLGNPFETRLFDHYGPVKLGDIAKRINGVMYSMIAAARTSWSD